MAFLHLIKYAFKAIAKFKRASRVLFDFEVMNTIFHYDLVIIGLNEKIITYMLQAKNQMCLFFFNYYLKVLEILEF